MTPQIKRHPVKIKGVVGLFDTRRKSDASLDKQKRR
jgi:hypothetical protein